MNNSNLFECEKLDDIKIFIESSKIIFFGFVLKETNKCDKILIRRFFKLKSKEYPNILFIYYVANEYDLGKISPFLPMEKDKYPAIFQSKEQNVYFSLCGKISKNKLEHIFEIKELRQLYDDDKQLFLKEIENNTNENENENKLSDDEIKKRNMDKIIALSKLSEEIQNKLINEIKKRKENEESKSS